LIVIDELPQQELPIVKMDCAVGNFLEAQPNEAHQNLSCGRRLGIKPLRSKQPVDPA
jgi:hypothetical protein